MRHIKPYQIFEASAPALTPEQKDWLDACTAGRWKLNPQTGLVDVDGDFDCEDQGLRDFKGVRFGVIGKSFWCYGNQLTSLEGAPQEVGGKFYGQGNQLTSLKGAPQKVGGDFDCSKNLLTSLEGAPQKVGNNFICNFNQLVSLKGSPQIVGGNFYCTRNPLTSLEGAPPMVAGTFYCSSNVISETAIERVLNRMSRNSIPLEQAVSETWDEIPEEDRIYLAKHNPDLSPDEKRGYEALERHKKRLI
jgi:hypothetical protein